MLDRAAGATTCQLLNTAGGALINVGVWTLWTGKASLIPFSAGALSLLASNYLCPDQPMGEAQKPGNTGNCARVTGGTAQLMFKGPSDQEFKPFVGDQTGKDQHVAILSVTRNVNPGGTGAGMTVVTELGDGSQGGATFYQPSWPPELLDECTWNLNPLGSATCNGTVPVPPDITQPIQYTDNVTNCTYNVTLQGFAQPVSGGPVQPVLLVEGASEQREAGVRDGAGGRMGGCNFAPTIYMPGGGGGNGGGGGVNFPVPDGGAPGPGPGDVPWWVPPLVAGATAAGLNLIGNEIAKLFEADFEPASFTLTAPCNKDEEGNPEFRTWEFAQGNFYERSNAHQVALMEIMQQHLDWKTPICDETPTLEGDFRTISFRSDQTSPYGKSRLRKRFRYRSVSGNDLSAVVDHWAGFTWEGGPYRVRWVGESWRSPEIWAASEAEGQRVIQHAAAEAGFSPLEGGRWSTRLSSSGRQGVPGTMRVDTTGGYYWITARDGSDERPVVALT